MSEKVKASKNSTPNKGKKSENDVKEKEKDKDKKKKKKKGDRSKSPSSSVSKADNIEVASTVEESNKAVLSSNPELALFEAGQMFSKFDVDGDGKLNKTEFTEMMKKNPEILRRGGSADEKKLPSENLPGEVISNRLLTHYDETAGVAISRSEVDKHKILGNTVIPLVQSYQTRYERLRAALTGKLLPKREHLLQLRRQLQNTSVEVDATRRGIERETLTDTEQILERLRTVESMRQSAVRHQTLQIEEELQAIERLVRRVEQANVEEENSPISTNVLLTSAHPTSLPVETIRVPRAINMVELIHQYADLQATIERTAAKPITIQVDFPTDDFPRETSERLAVLSKCDRYTHALSIKDHMLWTALQELERSEDQLLQEKKLSNDYAQEVANWAEMAQTLTQQIMNLKQENSILEKKNKNLTQILRDNNIYYMN